MFNINNPIISSKYKILDTIHQGGFGFIYYAEDIFTKKKLAIKQSRNGEKEYLDQFLIEAKILRSLNHKNLPQIVDLIYDNEQILIVMEYIDGQNLYDLVKTNGKINPTEAIRYINDVAEALSYLHSQTPSIIHRDVKPANIILTRDSKIKLVDFGIAKEVDQQRTATVARAITPGFSPPEQYGQGPTGLRSDIYSLGATLFFLLTGETPQESIERYENDKVNRALNDTKKILPNGINNLIAQSMSLQIANRFSSIKEFILELRKFNFGYSIEATSTKVYPSEKVNSAVDNTIYSSPPNRSNQEPRILAPQISIKQLTDSSIIIDWSTSEFPADKYILARKYQVLPSNPNDGYILESEKPPVIDMGLENGKMIYYALWRVTSNQITGPILPKQPIMLMGDVREINIERCDQNTIRVSWLTPPNVKDVLVRKTFAKPPLNRFAGNEVKYENKNLQKNVDTSFFVDKNAPANINIYYSFYCQYQKSKYRETSVLLTSAGKMIGIFKDKLTYF
jgi:serine/threonine protein kinase